MHIPVPEQPTGRLTDAWRTCVGTGRFELALRRDYQDSLALVQREIGFRHIRGHGLLSDGVGVYRPYEHQGSRQVRHNFGYVDQVVDAYLELGIRPFVELGFMPAALASGDQTVFWWQGNVTPPRSESEWADLVKATVGHLVDRYGLAEVRRWPIEVWNEPNLEQFWQGADESAYHRLYEVTAHAVKEVDAGLQVGGPAISPGADEWLPRFADFVAARDVPIDFVSKHAYTSGPAQHVPFGVHQTLAPASRLLEQFGSPRSCSGTPPWPGCRCTSPSSTPRTGRTTRSTTPRSTPRTWPRCWWPAVTWSTPSRTGPSATCSRRSASRPRSSTAVSACSPTARSRNPPTTCTPSWPGSVTRCWRAGTTTW
ncbi:hypothetical protein GCM10027615_62700 [Plantactinospora veratri]